MKKAMMFAGALALAATTVVAPNAVFAAQETKTNAIVQPEASSFWTVGLMKGETYTNPTNYYNSSRRNIAFSVHQQIGQSPSVNYYLVNSSGVAVRGPITVTGHGDGKTVYFYDVPAGTYKLRMVNNSPSYLEECWGYIGM